MEELYHAIKKHLDNGRVSKEVADLSSYSFDVSVNTCLILFVSQCLLKKQHIVKLSNQYDVPIYPRGSGTSLSGDHLQFMA